MKYWHTLQHGWTLKHYAKGKMPDTKGHTHILWFHLRELSRTSKPTEMESRVVAARGWGRRGSGEWLLNAEGVSTWGIKKFWKWKWWWKGDPLPSCPEDKALLILEPEVYLTTLEPEEPGPGKPPQTRRPSPSDAEEQSQPEMGGRWPKTSHYSDWDGGESHWTWAQFHTGLTSLPEPSTQLTAVQTHRAANTIQGSINQNKNKKVEVGVWRYTIKHIHKSEMNYYRKRKTFLENMCLY